ncbi:transposase domain-containing protein [Sphingomonas bacterium]|uniref:transposase domain-containing protein n=1 Tax=Sphingomonas bacterium TaxID=1895847 RepID=UPI0020C6D960|nr:transposase domain-containing protein [Sphingomonas bacterium]
MIVADRRNVSERAIASWFKEVRDVAPVDRLPRLAPRYRGGGKAVAIDAEALRLLKTDYLRAEKPAFAACYNRLVEDYARPNGIALPDARTLKRRLDAEISVSLKRSERDGKERSRRSVPPQLRSVADLHAMEAVNVDGHTFDVFVQWEDGRIGRPVMVGIQDVAFRKLLAHRIGETESTLLTRLAFADLFRDHGIPPHAVMDNGRAFASKALTGGALTRFRFKVEDTDATGVLTALGVQVHWTLPYRGSSKPIERAWRDLCEDIAKHPAVAGAYTGNRPDAKPENYRERAIPIAEFRAHVARRIAAHNAREGRRTEMAKGGSFDAAFAASYEVSPIGRARPEQLRRALLEAIDRRCNKDTGAITLAGNVYWSAAMPDMAGKVVTLRFDPENLHADVHVYLQTGEYFGAVPVWSANGFFDQASAVRRRKLEKDHDRKVREEKAAANLLRIDQLAAIYAGAPTPAARRRRDPARPPSRQHRRRAQALRAGRRRARATRLHRPLHRRARPVAAGRLNNPTNNSRITTPWNYTSRNKRRATTASPAGSRSSASGSPARGSAWRLASRPTNTRRRSTGRRSIPARASWRSWRGPGSTSRSSSPARGRPPDPKNGRAGMAVPNGAAARSNGSKEALSWNWHRKTARSRSRPGRG